jgi:hypothetical protein
MCVHIPVVAAELAMLEIYIPMTVVFPGKILSSSWTNEPTAIPEQSTGFFRVYRLPATDPTVPSVAGVVPNVRETPVPDAVAAVLRVTVVPETAVTVVPAAMPVPKTEQVAIIEVADATVIDVVPDVVVPVVATVVDVIVALRASLWIP